MSNIIEHIDVTSRYIEELYEPDYLLTDRQFEDLLLGMSPVVSNLIKNYVKNLRSELCI